MKADVEPNSLVITTWLWGNKYDAGYVSKLAAGVARHLREPYRFICMTDRDAPIHGVDEQHPIKDKELLRLKGCFARLRMFDPKWQRSIGVVDRLVCLDLDVVITGSLDGLFDRREDFTILQGVNSSNPCPYNGSVMMLRAGKHEGVWRKFSLGAATNIQFHEFPDDQGWIWHNIRNAGAFTPKDDGVYAFEKPGWPQGLNIPRNARIVTFPGHRDPCKYTHLNWVGDNWHTGRRENAA